ncbi:MAG: hypothetical protein R3A52_27235 [Polyangiales bacterium]
MRWSVAIACAVMWTGCRSAPAPVAAPRATPEREPPTRVELLPYGPISTVGVEPDGWADLTFGGARVQTLDDAARFADDAFAQRIVLAVPVARGWVFCAEDGACAASETFLGPLRRVGDFPGMHVDGGPLTAVRADARGRASVIDRDGVAWTSDGGPFVRVATLPPVAVLALLFADERQGVATLDGGAFMVTTDGGARWARFTPPRRAQPAILDAALDVGLTVTDGRLDDGNNSLRALYLERVLSPRPGTAFDIERARGLDGSYTSDLYALVARRPAWVDLLDGEPLGAHGLAVRRHADYVEVDLRDGRARGWVTRERNERAFNDLARFGVPLAPPDDQPGRASESLPPPPDDAPQMRALFNHGSARGRTLLSLVPAGLGTCPPSDGGPDPPPITPLVHEGPVEEVRLNHEGTFTGVLRDDFVRRRFVVGRVDGDVVVRPLPPETAHVAFADPRRGLAWGDRWTRLLRTLDGGDSWHPLPVPATGAARASAASARPRSPWVPRPGRCTADRCLVGDDLIVTGWAREVVPPRPALTLTAPAVEGEAPRVGWRLSERLRLPACAPSGRATPAPSAPFPRPSDEASWASLWTNEGRVVASLVARPDGGCTATLAWWGLDERGLFRGATRAITSAGGRGWCERHDGLWQASIRRDGVSLYWIGDDGNVVVSVTDRAAAARVESAPFMGDEFYP